MTCFASLLSFKQAIKATRHTTGAAQGTIYDVLACPGRIIPLCPQEWPGMLSK